MGSLFSSWLPSLWQGTATRPVGLLGRWLVVRCSATANAWIPTAAASPRVAASLRRHGQGRGPESRVSGPARSVTRPGCSRDLSESAALADCSDGGSSPQAEGCRKRCQAKGSSFPRTHFLTAPSGHATLINVSGYARSKHKPRHG